MQRMQKTYDKQTAKFLSTIGENMPGLSGGQMQMWIQNPLILQKILAQLDQVAIIGLHPNPIQKWKTITVGGKTNNQLMQEFERFGITDYNKYMMRHCPEILTPHTAHLALVRPEDIGFVEGYRPSLAEMLKAMEPMGLSYHAAVGPYLRLAYLDQPVDVDFKKVAMEPIPAYDNRAFKAIWSLDNPKGYAGLTLIEDGSDDGWQLQPSELVCIMGKLEPITA